MKEQLANGLLEVDNVYELILKLAIIGCISFIVWVINR